MIDTGVETTGELERHLCWSEWCEEETSRILGQLSLTHPKSNQVKSVKSNECLPE